MTLDDLHALLSAHRFTTSSEKELQDGITVVLRETAVAWKLEGGFHREYRLDASNRVDFLVGDIGIEVKVKGSNASVVRQLHRYATFPAIKGLLLVTTLPRHRVPDVLLGKPVKVLRLGGL